MRTGRIVAGLPRRLLGIAVIAWGCLLRPDQSEAGCALHARGGEVKHVVQLLFENLQLRRDDQAIPSDLEQMPHLLQFLVDGGTIGTRHDASLPAETSTDILSILTGLHGDRTGIPFGDSFGYFKSDGSVSFATASAYWTTRAGDGKPLLLSDTGRTVPAPWVPFTRAGCDVGVFATANLALQTLPADVDITLGASSPDARSAASNPAKAKADLLGIAIHCARGSVLCANADARPDVLPDEPGGYLGFAALFGNRHVQPVISPDGPVRDIVGSIIADSSGNPGFPDAFEPSASQSFGYAATMLEAGIPVVYVSVGDLHDQERGAADRRASGPGEKDYVERLAVADTAFQAFIDRLAAAGISKSNTLFLVTSVGNERFVGGAPSPAGCDGVKVPCAYAEIGEIDALIDRLLATERRNVSTFDIRFGNAPAFYLRGNPLATDPLTRTLQQDMSKLSVLNPITGKSDVLASMLADRAEMRLLHMMTASAARAPSFIMFGDPGYVSKMAGDQGEGHTDCSLPPACVANDPMVPWSHGDMTRIIGDGWFGMAGPGVAHLGETADILSHHADLRPTMLALLGLTDSFVHDGVVLVEALQAKALPPELANDPDTYVALARAYKNLNEPLGQLGRDSLVLATQAIKGGDAGYERYLDAIGQVATARDALAREMQALLDGAAFAHRPIDPGYARTVIDRAGALINEVEDLAGHSIDPADRHWKAASAER
jgi:hypothetical protein